MDETVAVTQDEVARLVEVLSVANFAETQGRSPVENYQIQQFVYELIFSSYSCNCDCVSMP